MPIASLMDVLESRRNSEDGDGNTDPLSDVLHIARLSAGSPFAQLCVGAEVVAWSGETPEHLPLIEFATIAALHPAGTTIALRGDLPSWAVSMRAISLTGPYAETAWLIVVAETEDAFDPRSTAMLESAGVMAEHWLDRTVEQERLNDVGALLRQSQSDLQRSSERLEISNSELEQFAYVASHELVAPLRAVSVYAQLLTQILAGEELTSTTTNKIDSCVGEITRGVNLMSTQVQSLLELSSVTPASAAPEPIHISEAVANALATLAPQLEELNAQVTVGNLPVAFGQLVPLQSIFANLFSNSLRYCHPHRPLAIVVDAIDDGEYSTIRVRDNGVGVTEADAERIFALFERGATNTDGTGIGLALSRRIVESFDGSIGVETGITTGSVFWVKLRNASEPLR